MSIKTIDLRSDTKTLPTEEMLKAMCVAELGDSKAGEDPTVNKLEAMAAKRLGKEAALLVITGTMANLCAHLTLAGRGDAIVIDPEAHAYYYEGGCVKIAGLMPVLVKSHDGILDPGEIDQAIEGLRGWATPRLLHLENTHVMSAGRVVPLDVHARQCEVARKHGMTIHLDGARIFNAEVAVKVPAAEFAKHVDLISFCLSKNLSCPLGALLCGSAELIEKAKHYRALIGGGMRQAGVIAAAGIIALEKMIDRLAEDHANAKYLSRAINKMPGLSVELDKVDSNMIKVDISKTHLSQKQLIDAFAARGVLAGGYPHNCLRFVTHRHHDKQVIDEVINRMRSVMEK